MRVPALRIVGLTLVMVTAGCLGVPDGVDTAGSDEETPAVDGPMAPARLVEGDHWVQRLYHEEVPEDTLATIEYFVSGKDTLDVGDGPVETYRIDVRSEDRTIWIRVSDWALVQTAAGNAAPGPVSPVCEAYPWPLTEASEWDHGCQRLGTRLGNTSLQAEGGFVSQVVAEERVDVPAGSFPTFLVHSAAAANESHVLIQEYYSPEACFPAKVLVDNQETPMVLDLLAYQCGGA